jgi:hypothetical protein
MMLHSKEPKEIINIFEECKAQINSEVGESCERDLESGMPEPLAEWRRSLQVRVKDYTADETQYIQSI